MTQENHDSHELRALPSSSNDQGPSRKDAGGATSTRPVSSSSSTTVQERATTSTRMLWWPAFVFIFYTAFSLFPWITLCVMNMRPIRKEKSYHSVRTLTYNPEYWYAVNEKYFRTAEVFQSITAVITIPVTTTVCSMACVAYMQTGSLRKSLTLRQSMALADQGWVSPRIINTFSRSGSLPLLCALVLTVIGSISQIVQNALVGQETILASSDGTSGSVSINDVPNILEEKRSSSDFDDGGLMMQLRNLLESPYSSYDDANNWGTSYGPGETKYTIYDEHGVIKGDIYSPLPSDFTIGAYPFAQYSPRINSSTSYINITKDEFKENCRNETGNSGFYAKYEYDEKYSHISFEACMPTNLKISPWKATRDRQDINESLFLGISNRRQSSLSEIRYWKLEAKTSLGYFQLPGQVNSNTPSGLLDKDPIDPKSEQAQHLYRRAANMSYVDDDPRYEQSNMGPLAFVTIALFGRWSFLETRMTNASRFVFPSNDTFGTPEGDACIYKYPLGSWMNHACIRYSASDTEHSIYYQVQNFLDPFFRGPKELSDLEDSLNHALYMANKLWLGRSTDDYLSRGPLRVGRDPGIPTIKPKISQAGVVAGSILLAAHLMGLLLLTVYVLVAKPWSSTMGAEVMLKMGMVYSDELARPHYEREWKETLDKLPGYIGDERPGEEIGRLGLGAPAGLSRRAGRRFELLR